MDYMSAFEISASGMVLEKTRLDALAMNLANANTSRSESGKLYKPLRVIASARTASHFDSHLSSLARGNTLSGVDVKAVIPIDVEPRMVFDPGHPDADSKGFVAYPNINPVSEMVTLIDTVRAYEANVRAMNAAKTMAVRALEIGRQR